LKSAGDPANHGAMPTAWDGWPRGWAESRLTSVFREHASRELLPRPDFHAKALERWAPGHLLVSGLASDGLGVTPEDDSHLGQGKEERALRPAVQSWHKT
jgi:hypothetical protein